MFCSKCGAKNNKENIECIECGVILKKSNKFYIGISVALVTIIVILFTPIVVNYFIENSIKKESDHLKDIGLQLSVAESKGYFISQKDIEIKINNGRYFATNILDKLSKSSGTNLGIFSDALKKTNVDWEALLNGTTFKGKLVVNNYLLESPKLEIFLEKLSHEIMYEIQKDREANKIIFPLLDKKTLTMLIDFNLNGQIDKFKLKDIDETIVEKNDRLVFQLLNNNYENNILDINRFYLSVKNDKEVVVLQLDKIKALMNEKNTFKINMDNISFVSDEFKFAAQNFTTTHTYNNENNKANLFENISLENIKVDTKTLPVVIGQINYSLKLDDMAGTQFNQLLENYKDIVDSEDYKTESIFKFLNEGLALKINANIENLKVKEIHSGKYSFETNLRLNRNSLNLTNIDFNKVIDSVESLDGGESSFLTLKIDEDSARVIIKNDKKLKKIFEDLGYLENNKYSFQLSKRDGKTVLNNLSLALVAHTIGDNHFDNKSYNSAIDFYKYAVDNGNSDAHFRLAYSYNELKEYDLSIQHYQKYLNTIDPANGKSEKEIQSTVMNILADVYRNGKNDYKSAIEWYLKSIKNGDEFGDYVGVAYSYDMLKDYKNAEKWYLQSIEKDNEAVAMWNLGLIYEYGKGTVQKDLQKAIKLYQKAAALGYENAIKHLEKLNIDIKKQSKQESFEDMIKTLKDKQSCEKLIRLHAFLTRAQFQCGFNRYSEKTLEDARGCSDMLGKEELGGLIKFGMENFDLFEKEKGHSAACNDILLNYSSIVQK